MSARCRMRPLPPATSPGQSEAATSVAPPLPSNHIAPPHPLSLPPAARAARPTEPRCGPRRAEPGPTEPRSSAPPPASPARPFTLATARCSRSGGRPAPRAARQPPRRSAPTGDPMCLPPAIRGPQERTPPSFDLLPARAADLASPTSTSSPAPARRRYGAGHLEAVIPIWAPSSRSGLVRQ
nr:vegetative cell wall protein gp1-like [Aegilops tauschii subsp. strangulata]